MTNVSDNEQVMSEEQPSDSDDEVLMKPEDKQKPDAAEDDSSDEELLALKQDRKSELEGEDKSKQSVNKMLQLPVSRIKTIMKSSPELANVKPESYVLITRATELFVQYLAQRAHETGGGGNRMLEYSALSNVVSKDESLDFLEEIVPFKIKMKDYWEKYGYPKKPADEIEIVEIDSNGSSTSNGHADGPSSTPSSQKQPAQKQTPKPSNLNNSSASSTSKLLKSPGVPKPTKLSSASKTPLGKTQKTIDSTMKMTPKNSGVTPVNGLKKVTPVNGSSGKSLPEVICIDD